MKNYYFTLLGVFFLSSIAMAQSKFEPISIEYGTFLGETMPLRDFPKAETLTDLSDVKVIEQNFSGGPQLNPNALPIDGDPLAKNNRAPFRSPGEIIQNFDGIDISQGGAVPPDPSGAVGPNHYVHAVNLVVEIYDKTGVTLAGPTSLGAFLGNGSSNGDPIILYDQLADRFFVSQFQVSNNAFIVGVSTTPDPTGTYNVYSFPQSSFPDYPHFSVWHNSYIVTANKQGQVVYAMDREAIINGDPNPAIVGFSLPGLVRRPSYVFGAGPANLLGTDFPADAPGYIVYMQDDGWSGAISEDHIKIWSLDLDFVTPANSTVSAPQEVITTPFDSVFFAFGQGDVTQPGTSNRLDNIGSIVSYMVNYRTFPSHNSLTLNFNVDLGGQRSGIRWYELRNDATNGPFTIHQEGTYDLDDGEGRFMGGMAMDANGNMGLAYNVGSSTTEVGIRFTGRLATDPLGEMTFDEEIIQDGVGIQTTTNRFGDYAQLTMDPDGETFWHTAEYFRSNNAWRTKVAAFRINETLGTDDLSDANAGTLSVIPNGTSHQVIVSEAKNLSELQYQVVDIQGRTIANGQLEATGNIHRAEFNTQNLSTGVYVVKVASKNFNQSKKFIIK